MPISLEAAVEAFQAGDQGEKYWEEYGLSDEDVAVGLRAAFTALGVEFADDALFLYGDLATPEGITKDAEQRRKRAEEKAAWRAAHPEEAARMDKINAKLAEMNRALIARAADRILKGNSTLLAILRSKGRLRADG